MGSVTEVGVGGNDEPAAGDSETMTQCAAPPGVLLITGGHDAGIGRRQASGDGPGIVAGTIVDKDNFVSFRARGKYGRNPFGGVGNIFRLVISRDNNAHINLIRHGRLLSLAARPIAG